MSVRRELPWGGQLLDPTIRERAVQAAWLADDYYRRELDAGNDPEEASRIACARLRAIHAAEMNAAAAHLAMRHEMASAA